MLPDRPSRIRYELKRDLLNDTFTIRRIEDIGPFESREAAHQYMIDTAKEREARDA